MQRPVRVLSLGREDLLEKEKATHSSTLAWRIRSEEPGKQQSTESHRVRHDWMDLAHTQDSSSSFYDVTPKRLSTDQVVSWRSPHQSNPAPGITGPYSLVLIGNISLRSCIWPQLMFQTFILGDKNHYMTSCLLQEIIRFQFSVSEKSSSNQYWNNQRFPLSFLINFLLNFPSGKKQRESVFLLNLTSFIFPSIYSITL